MIIHDVGNFDTRRRINNQRSEQTMCHEGGGLPDCPSAGFVTPELWSNLLNHAPIHIQAFIEIKFDGF
jgi:hypothetical protein